MKMKKNILAAFGIVWGLGALVHAATPWDDVLNKPASKVYPAPAEVKPTCNVKGVMLESEPFKGRPTRVFAWYGLPEGTSATKKCPAMVLIHGGNGTAYDWWVKMWNERGYAAISMDTCGSVPIRRKKAKGDQCWLRHDYSGPEGWGGFDQIDEPLKDQWTYHAVAAAIRAHTFLRSLPEVDAERIGVTGISWGGYLTCIVAGVDPRYKWAVPVYGCGFYGDDSSRWKPQLTKMGTRGEKWLATWDAGVYLGGATCPFLWVSGTTDAFFKVPMLKQSAALTKGPKFFDIRETMVHGHKAGSQPEEIHSFADHFAFGKPLHPNISDHWTVRPNAVGKDKAARALPGAGAEADPFMIGAGGFSDAVCNEKGVQELKDFGADFARCLKIGDRATLDLFAKYGLKAVAKGIVPGWWGGKTEWAGLMHEKRPLKVYAKAKEKFLPHPAIMAVDIGDEPSKSDFAHYAKVVEYLNGELPGVPFTLNLFPSYGSHIERTPEERLKQLGTASYEDYIRSFCEQFPTMKEVSFDFYPYSAPPAEVEAYLLRRLADFAIVSRACREYNRRLVFCLQANSLFKELEMDLPRLRYQAFTALAFGTRRMVWECYTPSWWENNILEKDGSKTPRWERVRTVNAELHALTKDFARFRSIGTRLEGFSGDERKMLGEALDVRWRDFTAVRKISCDGKLVIGEFKANDDSGDTAVLVAAAWDPEGKNPGAKRLRFRADGSVRVYGQNGEVTPVRERDGKYALDLPSDGAFFIVGGVPPPLAVLPANADDQQRRFSPASDETMGLFADMGFNTFTVSGVTRCDFTTDDPTWGESLAELARTRMKRIGDLGAAALFPCGFGRDKKLSTRYSRIDRKGEKVPGRASIYELDAAEPAAQAAAVRAMRKIAKEIGREPGFAGLRPCGEIRLRTTPSFTARNAAAYRADTGREVPPEAMGRAAPHWRDLKDIPENRIVSEHHPVLAFYRWFWQKGDGWNAFADAMVEAFLDETGGRRVLTEYEPCLRTPPLFGCGGDMEMVGQWFYSYNDSPVNVGFDMAHIDEVARGTPGQRTIVGLQCICHLSRIANPKKMKKGATPPEWYALRQELAKKYPDKTYYPAMPPDLMRIGLWTAASRQTDGFSFHGWECVFDPAVYPDKFKKTKKGGPDPRISGYQYTNPDLKNAISDFFRDVAVPYGPFFKMVPERSSDVSIFLGWASAILSGTAYMDWDRPHLCGVTAVAANLSPSVLFEEDVEMNGVPEGVKVLLMPEAEVLTEGAYVRLRDFQRKGGKLVAFKSLTPALTADANLPAFCEPPPKHALGAAAFETAFRSAVEEMKKTVSAFVAPRVTSDSPFICAHARGEAAYDLLFVVNDRRGPGEYAGVFDTVLDKGLPATGTVSLKRNAKAVYDLLAHKRIECPAKDGAISLQLSLKGAEGCLFLVCDRELGALTVSAKRVADGTEVSVFSPDKDVLIPIRVDGVGKKPFYGVVKNGSWRHVFAEAAEVCITNLANGQAHR